MDTNCHECGKEMAWIDYVIHHTCYACTPQEKRDKEGVPTLCKPRRKKKKRNERVEIIIVPYTEKSA